MRLGLHSLCSTVQLLLSLTGAVCPHEGLRISAAHIRLLNSTPTPQQGHNKATCPQRTRRRPRPAPKKTPPEEEVRTCVKPDTIRGCRRLGELIELTRWLVWAHRVWGCPPRSTHTYTIPSQQCMPTLSGTPIQSTPVVASVPARQPSELSWAGSGSSQPAAYYPRMVCIAWSDWLHPFAADPLYSPHSPHPAPSVAQ
jgi:hypothetical protein